MKALACGLETSIKDLTGEQINNLNHKPVEGILIFREVLSEETRDIPFELKYVEGQREYVEVKVIPKRTYFGEANKIIFTINEEYYENLKEEGLAEGARFFWGTGKLYLYAKTRKSAYDFRKN